MLLRSDEKLEVVPRIKEKLEAPVQEGKKAEKSCIRFMARPGRPERFTLLRRWRRSIFPGVWRRH